MGRIKDHFHDEIVAEFEADDAQRAVSEPALTPQTPVHVLMERNEITGETRPVQIYTLLSDAQDDLRLLRLGRRVFKLSDNENHYIVEGVPCL